VTISGVIDADGHVSEPAEMWLERLAPEHHVWAPRLVRDDVGRWRFLIAGQLMPPVPTPKEWAGRARPAGGSDPKARLVDMDSEGIDTSVLFTTTGLFFGGIEHDDAQIALCRAYNDWLGELCAVDPDRLVGVAIVPQNDIVATVDEARRAITEHGFRAVMVRPNLIRGRSLHHPAYEPLWAAMEELGATVAVHEGTTQNVVQSGIDRFESFAFRHACSHPHEQQFGCLSLVCGGVLERHPALRVVFLESGCGWVPYWLERLDEHMEKWSFATSPLPHEPSEYFLRQCFVSTEPDERTLPATISVIGDDNIVFASDYPHPDAIFPGVVAALADRADISDTTKTKILATNPARCFGLA
jgi:predicted TIM-barrel fold metal-dependent hydrolase